MTATQQAQQQSAGTSSGRVALVTGGTSGIGAAICRSLASQGASIAAGFWGFNDRAEEFQAEMKSAYPDRVCTLHEANNGVPDDCRRMVREVIDQHGRLDILVNDAGITIDRTVAKMTDGDWQKVIDVNLSGTFFVSQAALPHMIERGTGRIISISSLVGEIGNVGQANYAASKAGIFGLTKTLAKEAYFQLGRAKVPFADGIGLTVNAVTPGFVATEMVAAMPEEVLARFRKTIPAGRLGTPEDIARLVAFLAADEASYITGQIWSVNGGLDM
jgi:acetoacetyl-CoA reductase/3-oxoacyl-[acyl-carrier protein] reductase